LVEAVKNSIERSRPLDEAIMTRSTTDDNSVLLVHAYLDGELDPANALGIAQQISTEPGLAAESERVKALQRAIRERLPREEAPPGLRPRIEASVGGFRRQNAQPSWRALAASILLTAMVASSSTWFVAEPQPAITTADLLVSDHIRALMAPEPVDVVSSDRHTVKPWFNGRIPNSPRVVDLAKEDFPLIGGRIDVVGQTPVSTLVYRRAKHLISLTAMPAASNSKAPPTVNGYNVVHWIENGVSYWAISDLAVKELEDFAQLFRTSPTEL
jgi:anti-sigma factor RsiW